MGERSVAHSPLKNLRDLCVLRGELRFLGLFNLNMGVENGKW